MKDRRTPMRRCIGCRESFPQNQLIRLTLHDEAIHVDRDGKSPGRGVYLCKNSPDCLEKADKRRALERAFSMTIAPEVKQEIFARIAELDDLEPASDDGSGKGQDA